MKGFLLSSFILLFLCSCASRMPEPITYEYTQQKKMQASNHWGVLAKDLANKINNQLILTDNIDRTVFVEQTCGDEATPCQPNETSPFNEAFRDLLITGLYDFGIPTNSIDTPEAVKILYKVQIVRHNAERARSLQPGLFTAISSAIVVLRDVPSELIILATGIATDIANTSLATLGHYEVIITTSIIDKNQYLFRASDIYYINDEDFYHYQETMPQTKSIPFASVSTAQKKPVTPSPSQPLSEPEKPGSDSKEDI